MRRLQLAGLLLVVGAAIPSACSGDDGGQAAELEGMSFCDLQERIDNRLFEALAEVGQEDEQAEGASADALRDAADELRDDGVLDAAAAAAPDAVAAPAATLLAAIEAVADGDTAALEQGDAVPARQLVDDHCFGGADEQG